MNVEIGPTPPGKWRAGAKDYLGHEYSTDYFYDTREEAHEAMEELVKKNTVRGKCFLNYATKDGKGLQAYSYTILMNGDLVYYGENYYTSATEASRKVGMFLLWCLIGVGIGYAGVSILHALYH